MGLISFVPICRWGYKEKKKKKLSSKEKQALLEDVVNYLSAHELFEDINISKHIVKAIKALMR